eukprot:13291109-Alexandrium_andersonii.AAC.1
MPIERRPPRPVRGLLVGQRQLKVTARNRPDQRIPGGIRCRGSGRATRNLAARRGSRSQLHGRHPPWLAGPGVRRRTSAGNLSSTIVRHWSRA